MTNIQLDHFLTYTSAGNIDDYLKEYAAQGFRPHEETVRHDPGLRNGFIFFGPEYVELLWVEDEVLFAEAAAEEKLLRTAPRPFGLGMIAEDVQAVHADWTARGYTLPEVWSKVPRDAAADIPPAWSLQDVPTELLPGVSCFALTYHTRPKGAVKQVKPHPNSIYALSGVTFVAAEPEALARLWRNLLAPGEPVVQAELGFEVLIGPHRAMWMTPAAYQAAYGLAWVPSAHPYGELALLHLLASDLRKTQVTIEQSGRRTVSITARGEEELLVAPDARDGFVFSIHQQPVERWLRERMARTGERLKLAEG